MPGDGCTLGIYAVEKETDGTRGVEAGPVVNNR